MILIEIIPFHFFLSQTDVGWLFGFYGLSTFVGYLMPNSFLYKWSVLFQKIQFSMRI